jgi:hypothetical protein
MEEAPENGKESSHSAHANGIEYKGIGHREFVPPGQTLNGKFY